MWNKIKFKIRLFIYNLLNRKDRIKVKNYVCYICGNEALPKPLEADEERVLLEEIAAGNTSARDSLVEHNLRLVVYIAKRFESSGIEMEDLISVGVMGLIKAVKSYNLDKNIKLATYASRCIENEILMQLRKVSRIKGEVSIDEPLSTDGEGNELSLSDIMFNENDNVMKPIEESYEKTMLWKSIAKLDEREQEIMILRFGLKGVEERTQKEVADLLGISQSYISRIEKKILSKMRKELERAASE